MCSTMDRRPYSDCLNLISAFCDKYKPTFISECDCIDKVKTITTSLNSNWQAYINACAQFYIGGPDSNECSAKEMDMRTIPEKYYANDNSLVDVTEAVTDSIGFIWGYSCAP